MGHRIQFYINMDILETHKQKLDKKEEKKGIDTTYDVEEVLEEVLEEDENTDTKNMKRKIKLT